MKTVLRIIDKKGSEYIDLNKKYNVLPKKDDYITFNGNNYIVMYLDFDFDDEVVYIIIKLINNEYETSRKRRFRYAKKRNEPKRNF